MRKPCCEKEDTNKGSWSKQEDQKLIDYIQTHGEVSWRSLPKAAGLHRCGKSCKLRWINYLKPDIKRGNFAQDEEDLIIKLHALLGNRWSLIAGRLPGRTDNEVKNYWNFHIRRKLIKMGIDPNNHKLHQGFPRPHALPVCSGATSSSRSMDKDHKVPLIKPWGANDTANKSDTDQSGLEEKKLGSSSHLNLDLTMAFSSPRFALLKDRPKSNSESTQIKDMDSESAYPTLLLFN